MYSEIHGFKCEQCDRQCHHYELTLRNTQAGNYCQACGILEKCAACGDYYPPGQIEYKPDVQNYICCDCKYDYVEVTTYIKPLIT